MQHKNSRLHSPVFTFILSSQVKSLLTRHCIFAHFLYIRFLFYFSFLFLRYIYYTWCTDS